MKARTETRVGGVGRGTATVGHNYYPCPSVTMTPDKASNAVAIRLTRSTVNTAKSTAVYLSTKDAYDFAIGILAVVEEVHDEIISNVGREVIETLGFTDVIKEVATDG